MDKTTKPLTSGKQKADEPYPLTSLGIDTQTDEELKVEDKKRNQGMYITGSQGTGKSTFIEHVLYQDFVKNYAVIAIDPHGQLIDHLIASMPEHRLKDAYVLDMTDSEYAFGLNLFYCEHYDDPIERAIVIDQVEHIFEKIFADTPKGLLLPKVLRNITLTFLEHQGMTLTDVDNLLHNDAFRKKLTDQLKNPDVKRYWQQYDSMRPNRRERETEGIDNRLPTFLTAPFVKHIIGQPTSRLDVRKAILNHEILLIKLPMKRLLYTAGIIGTILLAYIHQATFSFENMKEEERPGFTLVVDEFQNFSTPDFAELFKEGRKYGARTFVANQDRHDLSDVNRRATLQAYTVLSFRTTPEDASDLAGKFIETTPKLHPEDIYPDVLKHLPEHQNPDVVSFYETYVRKLQRAAEERTRRYHYKNDEDEIIYPRYDFGAGTVSYDEREVQETLDLLNTLFLEAQKKDAVNERLKTGLIRQVSPFLDFVDYYNCLYCGECTSFEPKAKKDVEDVIRTYEECTGSLEAFQVYFLFHKMSVFHHIFL